MRKTIKQRRVEILKDVLLQIKSGKFKAIKGNYLSLPLEIEEIKDNNPHKSAQEVLLNTTQTCGVCAKGSLFLSTIRKENELQICDLSYIDERWNAANKIDFDNSRGRLNKIFKANNLDLIEAAFEKWIWYSKKDKDYRSIKDGNLGYIKNEKLSKFVKKYRSPKDRLIAIIKNAIKHDGIFTLN